MRASDEIVVLVKFEPGSPKWRRSLSLQLTWSVRWTGSTVRPDRHEKPAVVGVERDQALAARAAAKPDGAKSTDHDARCDDDMPMI